MFSESFCLCFVSLLILCIVLYVMFAPHLSLSLSLSHCIFVCYLSLSLFLFLSLSVCLHFFMLCIFFLVHVRVVGSIMALVCVTRKFIERLWHFWYCGFSGGIVGILVMFLVHQHLFGRLVVGFCKRGGRFGGSTPFSNLVSFLSAHLILCYW